jgi:SH3 domain-containing YSC84-like protein 1
VKLQMTLLMAIGLSPLLAKPEYVERLHNAASTLQEIMATPDQAIPQELLDKAYCVVIVPGLKKAGFIVGAKYGKGYVSCRKKSGVGWGPPATVRIEGGSFGFQIGASETDVVMLVMNQSGMDHLLGSEFTLGAGASIAAGPVGRSVTAQTSAFMAAEILSWSRTHGVFAGVSLQGATLRQDVDDNRELYGQPYDNRQILEYGVRMPKAARRFISLLDKYSLRRAG